MIGWVASALASLTLVAPILRAQTGHDARWLVEHGRWKQARTLLEERVRQNPNDAEATWLLSRVRLRYQDVDAALALAEKAVGLDSRNADYRWQLAQVVGDKAGDANLFKQIGLVRRFKREVEAALALSPNHIESLYGLMVYYMKAPGIVGGDKKKAYETADRISQIDKADGFIARVRLAQEEKQRERIEGLYLKALEADPHKLRVQVGLMNLYTTPDGRKLELAEKHARAAMQIDGDHIGPYTILADVLASQERWAELDAVLAGAEQRIPDNLSPYLRAADSLLSKGVDLGRAERYCRKYLAREPEAGAVTLAVAHWRLGLVLEKQGRRGEAIGELRTATRLDPKFEPARKDLGRLSP